MVGNEIIVSSEPRGRFTEGIIDDTSKPGTCMQVKAGVAMVGGRFTYEAYNTSADGEQRAVCVLLPDHLQGKLHSEAYTAGARGFLYYPANGEELNMLVANISGTADDHTIGELMMIDDGTGKLVTTTGSPEMESFQLLEAATDPTADAWLLCQYTGH